MSRDTDPLEGALLYEDRLPVAWRLLEFPLNGAKQQQQNESNEHLLRTLTLADGRRVEHAEEDHDLSVAVQRLEMKLDLVLDILSSLARTQQLLPEIRKVQFSAKGLGWYLDSDDPVPEVGTKICVNLHLEQNYPKGLVFSAQVVAAQAGGQVVVIFDDLEESVENALTKFIFQQHRRLIAQKKSGS